MRAFVVLLCLATACDTLKDAPPAPPANDAGPTATPKTGAGGANDDDDDVTASPPDAGSLDGGSCAGLCPPQVVANGVTPASITVDTKNVYIASNTGPESEVYACAKDGCDADVVEIGPGKAASISVIGQDVYWGDSLTGAILRCSALGCANLPMHIVTNEPDVQGVWTDGIRLVWATSKDSGSIRYCDAANCMPATAASGLGPKIAGIAVDQGNVVWSNGVKTFGCALKSCASPYTLENATTANVVYGPLLWSIAGNTIVKCTPIGCGQNPSVFVTSKAPLELAVDGSRVFWRDVTDKAIYRCLSAGCTSGPTTMATNLLDVENVGGIATDGLYVYWANGTQVLRVPK